MSTTEEQVNMIGTKLEVVASEVRHNESLLLRAEQVISDLVDVGSECRARNDVQDERMIRILEELAVSQRNIHELRTENLKADKEVVEALKQSEAAQTVKFNKFDDRIKRLEKWQWLIVGGGLAIMFIYKFIDLATILPAG